MGGGTEAQMRKLLVGVLAMMAAASHQGVRADQCPDVLANAAQLILVTPMGADQANAIAETFVRSAHGQAWRPVGGMRSAVVGLKGVAWGAGFRHFAMPGEPLKQEGDKRSPMGIYAMGPTFGFEEADYPGHLKLQTDQHICVEEPGAVNYGRIVPRGEVGEGVKFDQMRSEQLYRKGLVVNYPADSANKAGSCIFVHVWRQPGKGTAGCVALDEADVADLQAWASAAPTAIAILTAEARARFTSCLP